MNSSCLDFLFYIYRERVDEVSLSVKQYNLMKETLFIIEINLISSNYNDV
jgi:hypothetical protein